MGYRLYLRLFGVLLEDIEYYMPDVDVNEDSSARPLGDDGRGRARPSRLKQFLIGMNVIFLHARAVGWAAAMAYAFQTGTHKPA